MSHLLNEINQLTLLVALKTSKYAKGALCKKQLKNPPQNDLDRRLTYVT
jgi:hypothetical protein